MPGPDFCTLQWLEGSGRDVTYDIVHLRYGLEYVHTGTMAYEIQQYFPHSRSTYWRPEPGIGIPRRCMGGGFIQQAENLLTELRKRDPAREMDDNGPRPIFFVCWGTVGGVLLKYILLRLSEHASCHGDLQDLYCRVSGVFLLGCSHDERSNKFADRVIWSLMKESDEYWYGSMFQRPWKPLLEWIVSTTARFRELELPFPVCTYYESVETLYTIEPVLLGPDIEHSEVLCPAEATRLNGPYCHAKVLPLDHNLLVRITWNDAWCSMFLTDLREMVGALEKKDSVGPSEAILIEYSATRLSGLNISSAFGPEAPPKSRKRKRSRKHNRASRHTNNSQADSPSAPSQPQSANSTTMDYKIGWICALPLELTAAKAMLDEEYPVLPLGPDDETLFTLGRIGSHKVVIACLPSGRPGLSAASKLASDMRQKFSGIRYSFMVGTGGGVPSNRDDIRLGDVVVSQPSLEHGGVVQYDFGKVEQGGTFRRTGHLNNPPTFLLSVLSRVQTNHERGRRIYPTHMVRYEEADMQEYLSPQDERDTLFRGDYPHPAGTLDCTNCDSKQAIKRPDRNTKRTTVKIHYGTIASGNQVIKDAQTRDRIVKDLGGQVLCFEMEAAGLMNDFPCLVVRGISNYCDSHKNDGWQRYAAASAAAYTRELLLLIPPEDVVK